MDLAFTDRAELTAAAMGEPSFSHGEDEMLAAAVAALHTVRCRGGFVVFGSWCARHSLSPLG